MSANLNPEKALIFRIAHRDNLPWILDHGMHCSNSRVLDPNYRNIGNLELIDKRARRIVPVSPGGTLSDYVPFYFTPFSIMLYNIHTGYGVQRVPNDDIVIFVSSLRRFAARNSSFVFTNQHAYPRMAEYFTDLANLDRIDWPLLQSRNFSQDPDDPGKKERYQAEALIWKHVPLDAFDAVCCCNHAVEHQIKTELERRASLLAVAVHPRWYF